MLTFWTVVATAYLASAIASTFVYELIRTRMPKTPAQGIVAFVNSLSAEQFWALFGDGVRPGILTVDQVHVIRGIALGELSGSTVSALISEYPITNGQVARISRVVSAEQFAPVMALLAQVQESVSLGSVWSSILLGAVRPWTWLLGLYGMAKAYASGARWRG